ncbi:Zinc finger SWIM domain-containing protein 4 [Taenia solium]|eukprot:TsM_000155700 transcript=TsM_000155700 gene=TsM_000155700
MKRQFEDPNNVSRRKIRRLDPDLCSEKYVSQVLSLFDISAMSVAYHLPFEYVETTLVHVPDPVQERIIFYSFPRDSADIKTYSSFMSYKSGSTEKSPFAVGEQMFQKNCVEDAIQIGFHLTGVVKPDGNIRGLLDSKTSKVSMTFDRCKITSVCCTCNSRGLSWCPHAVALALFRINKPDGVNYRAPISDTLVKMDRGQLQKFAQYLIASHPNRVLASAQHLADKLLQRDSQMNKTYGAPDPTAGGGINDSSTWYFDESGVQEQLRLNLAALAAYGAGGCNAFDMISTPAASTSSSTTFSLSSSTYGRLFVNNSHSDFHHCRFSRFSARYSIDEGPITDENGFKPRNFAYRSFAHTWLENYRHLLRSKLPPFGYTTSASAATSSNHPVHSSVHSMHHHIVNANGGGSAGGGSMQSLFPSFTPPTMHSTAPHHFPGSQIAMVFAKTYELLASRDTNGPRLLAIITEELLNSANLMVLKSRRNNRGGGLADRGVWDPYAGDFDEAADDPDAQDAQHRQQRTGASVSQSPPIWTVPLWEEVARLWTCLLLAPGFSPATRDGWRQRLLAWSQSPQAPRDEIYFFPTYSTNDASPTEEGPAATRGSREPTSVFQLALDVSALHLEISEEFPPIPRNTLSELIRIMPADSRQCTCPFCSASMVIRRAWGAEEDFVTACLRASALHVMGFGEAATRLAVTLGNLLIACLEDVSHRSAILGEMTSGPCSPTPSPLTSQPPSFVRSNSGGSVKASGLNSTLGGSGSQSRGGFKSPPPPLPSQPQHFSPLQQRSHYSCTSAGISPSSNTAVNTSTSFSYFHFSPPSPSVPCVFPHNYHHHYQQGRHRFSSWQRMPQRSEPSQHLYCSSEVSLDCPFHEYGWLGLPGRPVISLVECLLEAASQKLQDPSRSGLSPSEYIHLALKVGILVLCQQRSLPFTSGALLASQAQEMLLIHLLNTIPRNAMTAQIIGPLVCQLMGPPPPSLHPMGTGTQGAWWWSALGPLVHPDTYPVHVVAELLFGHLLAGESAGAYTGELAYLVAARAMRLPVLESVSDSPLVINATTTTSTAHRHGDNLSRPSATISASNAFRSPPLPSTFFNAAMTPFSRLPVFFPPPPPPPLNYHRQGQETLRHQHPAFVNQDSAATAYRRDLGAMEGRQARLAISLILASRSTVFRMDHFMRVCDRHIHTSISLLSVSREVLAEAIGHRLHSSTSAFSLDEPAFLLNTSAVTAAATANATGITGSTNTGASLTAGTTSAAGSLGFANLLPVNFVTTPLPTNALQERISLVCAAFHLALCVTVRTAWPRVHWRRREMLGWAVSTGLLAGPPALLHLTQAWSLYASPREAVTWLAPTLLACIACVSPVSGPASSGVSTGVNGGAGVGARSSRSSAEGMLFLLPRIYSFFSFTPLAVEQIKIAIRQMTIQHLKEIHFCAHSGGNCYYRSGICQGVGEIGVVDQINSGSKQEGTCSDAEEDEKDFLKPLQFHSAREPQQDEKETKGHAHHTN